MFIRNAWYAAALSSEIEAELFPRTIANEQIVMHRTSTGEVTALEDRCPHRQVPLSKGCLKGDEIECAYHGLRFDPSGQCVHIPSQDTIPSTARTRAYPVAEKYGFVWIWPGDPALSDESSVPDHSICVDPNLAGAMHYQRGRADYRLGIDNFLDSSHVAFVHPGTVMSESVSSARPETKIEGDRVVVRRVLEKEKASPLFEMMMGLEYIDRIQDCIFWPVGNTRIDTTAHPPGEPNGQTLRTWTLGIFTPETEKTAHLWAAIYRDFEVDDEGIQKIAEEQLRLIISQDIAVVEQAGGNWDDDASIVHLTIDQGSNAARRVLNRLLEQEQV